MAPFTLISERAAKKLDALLSVSRAAASAIAAVVIVAAPACTPATTSPTTTPVHATVAVDTRADLAEPIVRAETGLVATWRAALDGAFAWIGHLASTTNVPIPDVSMLVREPVAMREPSDFGWRSDPFHHTPRFHSGADYRGDPGTPVVAAGDGVVVFAGWYGGYGRMIDIDHGGGVVTRYAHLRKLVAAKDARVAAGAQIGEVGQSGRATGPHLHFEVLLDGRAVDPVTALTVAELARTRPSTGWLAAFALAPEMQPSPATRPAKKPSRPERAGRGKRDQVLW